MVERSVTPRRFAYPSDPAAGVEELSLSAVPAEMSRLASVRGTLTQFAREVDLSEDIGYAFVLSAYEAMANIVEHAYPPGREGTFDLQAVYDPDAETLVVTIADQGTWNDDEQNPAAQRGRGLQLMRACSDRAAIVSGERGTQIHLQWSCRSGNSLPDE